jgi:membrane associated rhomboid family serine protease
VAVFVGQVAFGPLYESVWLLGFRGSSPGVVSLFTAVVAHAGWLHLLGNVYFLVAFGDGVEQYLPRWLLVSAFFVLGAATLVAEAVWATPDALIVGASGGVAVMIGACAVLQPHATVVTRIAVIVVPVRIVWYVAMEVALQGFFAWRGVAGVAWVAHLAGFAFGAVLGLGARRVWGRAFA